MAAITGANGYVGSVVADALTAGGFEIRRLVRRPRPDTTDHLYEIAAGARQMPSKASMCWSTVHMIFRSPHGPRSGTANVFGTRSLLDLAVSSGVRRTIFVSSMSAYAGTRQIYGRVKLASEIGCVCPWNVGDSSWADLWARVGWHGRSPKEAHVASARATGGTRCPPIHPSRG